MAQPGAAYQKWKCERSRRSEVFAPPIKAIAYPCALAPSHRSPITDHQSPITNHRLPITDYRLPITDYRLL